MACGVKYPDFRAALALLKITDQRRFGEAPAVAINPCPAVTINLIHDQLKRVIGFASDADVKALPAAPVGEPLPAQIEIKPGAKKLVRCGCQLRLRKHVDCLCGPDVEILLRGGGLHKFAVMLVNHARAIAEKSCDASGVVRERKHIAGATVSHGVRFPLQTSGLRRVLLRFVELIMSAFPDFPCFRRTAQAKRQDCRQSARCAARLFLPCPRRR